MNHAENVLQTIREYNGGTIILTLFVVCMMVLVIRVSQKGKKRLLLYFIISIAIVFNDISRFIVGKFTEVSIYYRFLWAVPVLFIIAYVATDYWFEIKEKSRRIMSVVLVLLLLFCGVGNSYLSENYLTREICLDKEEASIVKISEMIDKNKKEEQPRIAFDWYLQIRIRSYNASIQWGVGRGAYLYVLTTGYGKNTGKYEEEEMIIQAVNSGIQVEPGSLKKALKKKRIDYLIVNEQYAMDEYFMQLGWHVLDTVSGYKMYGEM